MPEVIVSTQQWEIRNSFYFFKIKPQNATKEHLSAVSLEHFSLEKKQLLEPALSHMVFLLCFLLYGSLHEQRLAGAALPTAPA